MTIVQPTASAGATFHALNRVDEKVAPKFRCIWHTTFELGSSTGFCQEPFTSKWRSTWGIALTNI
jgi:hypothetical protein